MILKEEIKNGEVICDGCGWSWKLTEGGDDKYICHKCGHDNSPNDSNFNIVINRFAPTFPKEYQYKLDLIKNFVKNYIQKNGFNVKFLNSCSTGFSGVRTKDQVIICSPGNMQSIGDFLYTIFHEIRHEQQVRDIEMDNPLSDYDLEDFEKIYEQYWEMELDADQFAKNTLAKIIHSVGLPPELSKKIFKVSDYIVNYPSAGKFIRMSLSHIVDEIKRMKKSGVEYSDIQDLPMVKRHLERLENFL